MFVFNAHQTPVAQEVLSTGADSIIMYIYFNSFGFGKPVGVTWAFFSSETKFI